MIPDAISAIMLDKLTAGSRLGAAQDWGVPSGVPAFIETARAACGSQLFHKTEHASARSARPMVDNVSDLARINFS